MPVQSLIDRVQTYLPKSRQENIRRAFEFASRVHTGQLRRSGDPYSSHLIGVAMILTELKVDEDTICAALLHHVLESGARVLPEIRKTFGATTVHLVEGVGQLSKVQYRSGMTEEQIATLQKVLLSMSKDIRVLIIKLASRLHNMRSLEYITPLKRQLVAQETLYVYAPVADALGIWSLRWQLEDMSFQFLQPEQYQKIYDQFQSLRKIRGRYIDHIRKTLFLWAKKQHIKTQISGRFKHFYSIYCKMKEKKLEFDEIYDVFAIRIIVSTVEQCYQMLGVVHGLYRPVPGRMKDYIGSPKPNGYRTLHTTVLGPQGHPVEFQIRTQDMDEEAAYGIAAHWYYKRHTDQEASRFTWLREVFRLQRLLKGGYGAYKLPLDFLDKTTFVFTPRGDVVELPKKGTPVDFAYKVSTDLGHRCQQAIVNGKEVSLSSILKTGDTVHIISRVYENPDRQWLQFVVLPEARQAIVQWWEENQEDEVTRRGRTALQKEVIRFLNRPISEVCHTIMLAFPLYQNVEQIYRDIADRKLDPYQVLTRSFDEKELLFSNTTQVFLPQSAEHHRFIGLKLQTVNDPSLQRKLFHTFYQEKMNLIRVKKRLESSINRLSYLFVIPVPEVKTLYTLFQKLERLDGVEGVIKN